MERIEDRSKALSYIGIEIAEALKYIPAPMYETNPVAEEINEVSTMPVKEEKVSKAKSEVIAQIAEQEDTSFEDSYFEETRFEVKPSFWQRIKNMKFIKKLSYLMKIRVRLDFPALPEGNGDNY